MRRADDQPPEPVVASWRADEAAAERRRAWWLERQAEQDATLLGVLLDLAEQGRPVVLGVGAGRRRVGRLWSVAPGVVGLRAAGGLDVLVPLSAITAVRLARGDDAEARPAWPVGHRREALGATGTLAEALADLVDDRPELQVLMDDATAVSGRLAWVGTDVALVADGPAPGGTYVPLARVCEVVLAR